MKAIDRENTSCILTRFIGHSDEINQEAEWWRMHETEHDGCYICDKWKYTLVFFNVRHPKSQSAFNQNDEIKKFIKKKIKSFNHENARLINNLFEKVPGQRKGHGIHHTPEDSESSDSSSKFYNEEDDLKSLNLTDSKNHNDDYMVYSSRTEQPFLHKDQGKEVFLFASFTNWKPKVMVPFLEYVESIDRLKPDFLADTMQIMYERTDENPRKVTSIH